MSIAVDSLTLKRIADLTKVEQDGNERFQEDTEYIYINVVKVDTRPSEEFKLIDENPST